MKVVVVGKSDLQTDLLMGLIRRDITRECRLLANQGLPSRADHQTLYIFDLAAVEPTACAGWLSFAKDAIDVKAVLINVNDDADLARLAALPGVYGIFLKDAHGDQFSRGLKAVLDGEYWLPRKVLCQHLENTRAPQHVNGASNGVHLSPKERQILALLTQGCSNEIIADKLAISPHTVKTHFYNLYKKLKVRNRVQAATWAQEHRHALEAD